MRVWIIGLAVAGVVIAIVLGLLGRSQTVAEADLCTSVDYLQSDIAALKNVDVNAVSKGSVQTTINSIQADWTEVRNDAKHVVKLDKRQLEDAWNEYASAIKSIPETATAGDAINAIKQHTQTLTTTVQQTVGDLDCSSS
jgi:hypothetical protein